jgi:hypothetical protein
MAIFYKLIRRKNPRDLYAPEKFYATVVTSGKAELTAIASSIAENTMLNAAEVKAVLEMVEPEIVRRVSGGQSTGLGDSAVSPVNPFKNTSTINSDKTVTQRSITTMSAYTIIETGSMNKALEIAKTWPFLDIGGTLDVSALIRMPEYNQILSAHIFISVLKAM